MPDHIVTAFTDELEHLSANLLRMGGLAESMIMDASRAVATFDLELARDVIKRDRSIDELEVEAERAIIRLIALRHPMAGDLRAVLGAMKLAGDIERIGDLCKNIAKRCLELNGDENRAAVKGIERMSRAVSHQLQMALDCYLRQDIEAAKTVLDMDDDIDDHYTSLFRETLTYMMEDPRQIGSNTHLIFMAKNLERIGDHATNIAKAVYYMVTGEATTGAKVESRLSGDEGEQR
ncbi:phosphate transport system regulatory protein PhoU [Henriciella barbarensis]|uniref:Phosphate-specific transport system accessory protein PhoU n=1 Tax=Henriciella barbarensis TaxID=86342 RepID=A0A399R1D8_9PROT|nr:phosphate signaling complex protein PhoU [Henriciella barbarensis]RIJ23582.1 phosphate transport system regulatory protein PhoU [Henriciella barbarensis]